MARFLVMTGPYPGHLAPSIPIVRKLIERRHEVVWITGREYKEKIEATGARFHPLPKKSDPNGMEIYDWHPELKKLTGLAQIKYWLKHVVLDACIQETDTIEAVLTDFSADVFGGDPIAFSLCFVSEERRVPCAQISVLPLSLPSCDTAPFGLGLLPGRNIITRARDRLLNFITHNILLHDLTTYANKVLRQIGLKLLNGPFFYSMFKKPTLVMVTSTPAFEYPRKNQPDNFQFIGPVLPEPDYKFHPPLWWSDLENPEPVILVNQGTLAKNLNDLIIPTIEGLKDEGMLVVAVPVKEGQLQELPTNVRAEPFIPFDHLLPHVDVMITNGGYGGTQWALTQGIPLVVAGNTEDKIEVAARVQWSGAGVNLRKKRPSPGQVRNAVKEVLTNPVYRENARRIQADFAKYDAPREPPSCWKLWQAVNWTDDIIRRANRVAVEKLRLLRR